MRVVTSTLKLALVMFDSSSFEGSASGQHRIPQFKDYSVSEVEFPRIRD
jgi:hypothetical protein